MGTQRSPQQSTRTGRAGTTNDPVTGTPRKAVTPPKGRPTRGRSSYRSSKRAFGPVAQWITVAVLVALIVVVLVLVTDGGDFNPFDDEEVPSQFGAPAAIAVPAA